MSSTRDLFGGRDWSLKPSATSRLRALARRPLREAAAGAERRMDENLETLERLQRQGTELAREFGLRFSSIERERDDVVEHYGVCYEDGVIRIRLRHAKTGRLLKESSLVDTLCHELAHLRHFDHSIRFRRLYRRILQRARELGYYRPGRAAARPVQRGLFDGEAR